MSEEGDSGGKSATLKMWISLMDGLVMHSVAMFEKLIWLVYRIRGIRPVSGEGDEFHEPETAKESGEAL